MNGELYPDDVIKMPLKEFERRFGFRPTDALEKHYFASNAKRLEPHIREALEAGVIGELPPLGHVVMDDECAHIFDFLAGDALCTKCGEPKRRSAGVLCEVCGAGLDPHGVCTVCEERERVAPL